MRSDGAGVMEVQPDQLVGHNGEDGAQGAPEDALARHAVIILKKYAVAVPVG